MIFRVISRSAPLVEDKKAGKFRFAKPCKEAFEFLCQSIKGGKPTSELRWVVNLYDIDQLMDFEKTHGPIQIEKASSWEEPLLTIDC